MGGEHPLLKNPTISAFRASLFGTSRPRHSRGPHSVVDGWAPMSLNAKTHLKSNISPTCPHNVVNCGPLMAEIGWQVWGTQANFNGFRVLASLQHRRRSTRSTEFYTMFGRLLGWYTIHTFSGALSTNGTLPGAKFTLRPSLAFSYIGSVTVRQSSSGRHDHPNFAAWDKEGNYRTFAPPLRHLMYIRQGGHYIGHRPTF